MKKSFTVSKEKTINATPGEVWKVITNPILFNDWMYVPGQIADEKPFGLGSKIQWTNDENVVYLEGKVIVFDEEKEMVISLQDISWDGEVPEGSVTYEYRLSETNEGTKVNFLLGDLAVDPEGEAWYDAYNASDEIGAIEKIILSRTQS
ncbi:MAG: hypothetical protein A2W86_07280 [Bacteroidetes bacterium GWD2_45_23]|jgi:uncharacterized protein YndB with AHSA1/START domain|nr:MAG: hypothetical protein A2W87_03635 [Bacteroidetes bacterium GWC2_46_850]OFX72385.1 MAG: hypothetical protein A2071_01015 [Bacteroidetes bacterium GWC1_47_7]OFX82377.1 MAG: hypothetical protein A2W86_07280 [Bacteroidetes bacterium GWD2_45_23]HBB01016.1 hypothetical protein [Porphyromonadaceae bacterium]HCC18853.1 hypothetical protein [Porphyromonadaceae bacterium]